MAKFGTFRPKINLRKFFRIEAIKNIIGKPNTRFPTYKSLLNKKKGIRLDNAPDNAQSTKKAKGKNHWMVSSGNTMKNGFKYEAKPRSLRVYASQAKHKLSKKVTYEQIFKWHNKGGDPSAKYNKSERYSGIFQKLPVGSKFPVRLVREVGKQIGPQMAKYLKRGLKSK